MVKTYMPSPTRASPDNMAEIRLIGKRRTRRPIQKNRRDDWMRIGRSATSSASFQRSSPRSYVLVPARGNEPPPATVKLSEPAIDEHSQKSIDQNECEAEEEADTDHCRAGGGM